MSKGESKRERGRLVDMEAINLDESKIVRSMVAADWRSIIID
jgi:hypothetical protein